MKDISKKIHLLTMYTLYFHNTGMSFVKILAIKRSAVVVLNGINGPQLLKNLILSLPLRPQWIRRHICGVINFNYKLALLYKMSSNWGYFYKNIWIAILDMLPQTSWHVMIVNRAFRALILNMVDDAKINDVVLIREGKIRTFMRRARFNEITVYWLAKCGYKKIVQNIIGADWWILRGACSGGHVDLMKRWDVFEVNILYDACEGGNEDVVNILVNDWWKNSDIYFFLRDACKSGNKNIVKMLLEKSKYPDDWDEGLIGACAGGHIELAEMMIEQGANCWNQALLAACETGKMESILFLIEKGAMDWNAALSSACVGGNMPVFKFIMKRADNPCWNICLNNACQGGNLEIIKICVEYGAKNYEEALPYAIGGCNVEAINYLVQLGACNWNKGLSEACGTGVEYIIQMMINLGATDWNAGLKMACIYNHQRVINWMIKLGATKCGNCNKEPVDHYSEEEKIKYKPQN